MTSYALPMRLFAEIVLCWDEIWKRPFSPLKPLKPLDLRGPRSPLSLELLDLGALKEPSSLGPLATGFWERQTFESPS